ncbi:MAG: FtsX-like permease family protein [Planctomycetota bacterium]|mgnify:CR=1 FL=1|nr:FtsX-like permease family protein [Planctomycetota bacterium]
MIQSALFTRPVAKHPVRFLATVLGIAAGVASVVSTLGASSAALSSLREGVGLLSGRAALEVTAAGGVPESELTRLAPLALDALLLPVVEDVAKCTTLSDTVRVFGVDLLTDPRFAADSATIATAPPIEELLSTPSAIVSDEFARDARVGVGDSIHLTIMAKPISLRVAAIFPAGPSAVLGRLVVVDVSVAQRFFGRDGNLSRIELVPRGSVSSTALSERARELVSRGMQVGRPTDRAEESETLVRSLEFNLATMSGISLLVGGVLVATTLATSVVQRRRTIALLYALGASRGQVVRVIFAEALFLGVFGGILGVALGYVSSRFMVDGMRATLSTLVSTTAPTAISFDETHAWLGIALGVVVSLAAAVLPVLEGARTPPIQALRGETPRFLSARALALALSIATLLALVAYVLFLQPAWYGLPIAALAGALVLLAALLALYGPLVDGLGRFAGVRFSVPAVVRLACAGLSAGRRRAAWAAGAVGVAVALSIAIATMVGSFRGTVVDWVERSIHPDLAVRGVRGKTGVPVGGVDREVAAIVSATPGVVDTYPYFVSSARFGDERIGFGGVSFEAVRKRGWSAMLDGSDSSVAIERAWKSGGVLVSEAGAHRFGWKVGDQIAIDVRGQQFERAIEGVYMDHSESRGFVLADAGDFERLVPDADPLFVELNCRTPADIEPVRSALRAAFAGRFEVEINDMPTMRASILSVFDRTFEITRALQIVSAIVAIIAVLSVLFALVSERRADIALLSAIGMSSLEVHALVAVQAGLLGVLGAGFGSACGLVIGYVLVTVVNLQSFGWTIAFDAPWIAIASLVGFVAAACTLAGTLPARAAAQRSMRDALREDG